MNKLRFIYGWGVLAAVALAVPMASGQEDAKDVKPAKVSKTGKPGKEDAAEKLSPVASALYGRELVLPGAKLNTKAKVFFLYQSRSTCGICVAEAPELVKAYKSMKGKGAELVMLNIDANKEEAAKWAKRDKMKFPIIAPGKWQGVPFPYAGEGLLPVMVALDANGNKLGEANANKVAAFVQDWKKFVREYEKEERKAAKAAKKAAQEDSKEQEAEDEA